jgi:hypothetical protein
MVLIDVLDGNINILYKTVLSRILLYVQCRRIVFELAISLKLFY